MPLPTIGKDVSPARRKALRSLAGKAVLFLDTCHPAGAIENSSRRGLACLDINSVINEFASAENGAVAFASSTGREDSVENDAWQNGAFTKTPVEGLRAGWVLHTGAITLTQLDAFVVSRVKDLTSGLQHPVMTRPPAVRDFPSRWSVSDRLRPSASISLDGSRKR